VTESFYRDLPAFIEFADVSDIDAYRKVPDDWYVLAADIVRSRDAIAAGRYREVNIIGSAVIAAVLNRLGRDRIPFVFGGDGALLLVPGSDVDLGRTALSGVAALAQATADLTLRVAAIPVSELRKRGADIRLRKHELSPGNHLAMAVGDGLELADRILKDPQIDPEFVVAPDPGVDLDFDGLSCRWEAFPARKDAVVTLIVKPAEPGALRELVDIIETTVGIDPLSSHHNGTFVSTDRLRFKFPPSFFARENRILGSAKSRWRHALMSVFENLVFLYGHLTGRSVGPFHPKRYLSEIVRNTDHRRLDDALRLVLDLTNEDVEALSEALENARRAGRVDYGLHVSKEAMFTCFVSDLEKSQHIHFIDGTNGGFAKAADDFKLRESQAQKAG